MNIKKTAIAAAMTAALGVTSAAQADTILHFDYEGWMTMLDPAGAFVKNASATYDGYSGERSAIEGTIAFNLDTFQGTGTMVPIDFFNQANPPPATVRNFAMGAIGDGAGGPGTLVLGNLLFDWNNNYGIAVSIVVDAAGLFGYAQGGVYNVSDTITGVGVQAASATTGKAKFHLTDMLPIATTTWDTTTVAGCSLNGCAGTNPSGELPLITDTVGGVPMVSGAFPGNAVNFDLTTLHLTEVETTVIPVPAAVWLFGSGLLGLVGVARRKKQA